MNRKILCVSAYQKDPRNKESMVELTEAHGVETSLRVINSQRGNTFLPHDSPGPWWCLIATSVSDRFSTHLIDSSQLHLRDEWLTHTHTYTYIQHRVISREEINGFRWRTSTALHHCHPVRLFDCYTAPYAWCQWISQNERTVSVIHP